MKRYRRLRQCVVWFLVAELIIGMGGWLTPRHEVFPFAAWFLFLLVPYQTSDYDLVLRAEGTRPLDPPPSFNQASGALVQASHSIVSYQVIQQLGDAEKKGDDARSLALRRQIEAQFRVPFIHYDLVRVEYHPVERWQTGQIVRRTPLKSFTAGQVRPETAAPLPNSAPEATEP